MLPRSSRIPRALFDTVLKNGKSFHGPLLSFSVYAQDKPTEGSRFSCVVSKKVANKAVVRNKIRRRCYSTLQKHQAHLKPGILGIFFFKKGAKELSSDELAELLVSLLKKAKIYEKSSS